MHAVINQSNRRIKVALLCMALIGVFIAYAETAQSLLAIWDSSETFAHGYIIAPMSLWLIWRRRQLIASIDFVPYWPALILLSLCGFAWLLADFAEVQVVKQYAFVAMIPVLVLCILGLPLARALAFPLTFLLFAVPFGEVFIPPLIDFTANFTVGALQLSGIPVLREGNRFAIPSGDWSVVEACSGVRYLISSITLGCLYAYLTYKSWWRRALFVVFSIVVPILANGLRAYLIVMIGHLSSMQLAVGFDHLIYGWIFFGLVMFFMFWIGSFWRQTNDVPLTKKVARHASSLQSVGTIDVAGVLLCAIVCFAIWPIYANYSSKQEAATTPIELNSIHFKWTEIAPFSQWKPGYAQPRAELDRYFQRDWYRVGISVRYYKNQTPESKLVSSFNQLLSKDEKSWRLLMSEVRDEKINETKLRVLEHQLQDHAGRHILVWQFYLIDDTVCINPYFGKFLQARAKLLMHGDDGSVIFAFAPYTDNTEEARLFLRPFLRENLSSILDGLSLNTHLLKNGTVK